MDTDFEDDHWVAHFSLESPISAEMERNFCVYILNCRTRKVSDVMVM
ncbi:hypothetical protein FRUB_02062 [Fimbriiglobus ruber]|uniref:Uncharacterized protein n=1 Tax=Fimbriiglobus ruber TaxID=1908690 RepID=A0A225DWK1_9BACT|nr:hypothetical protein FRUB_02062 [Fimbriiglobus ruber]